MLHKMSKLIQLPLWLPYILTRYPLFVLPAVLLFMVECLSRASLWSTTDWFHGSTNELLLNYWIAFSLIALLTAAFGRTRVAYSAVFTILGVAAFLSGMKTNQTGTPLYFWDILFPYQTKDAVAPLNPSITVILLATAAAAVIVLVMMQFIKHIRVRLQWKERTLYATLSVFLLYSIWRDVPIPFKTNSNIFTISWDQADNYTRNGYLLSSFMAYDLIHVQKPSGTQGANIRNIIHSIEQQPATGNNTNLPKDPNIIVLLSESFWDPMLMKNVTFSEDPIPKFRSLMRDYTSGWMLSPQFGGNTANVEFEVLSGNSMRFLPEDSLAYIEFMNHGVDSLASILSRQGYTATALNPFFNWFFNSRNAYKNLGFSRFIALEHFDPEFHGPNLEDSQVMRRIEEATASTPGPDFIFANTMENHGPYKDKFSFNPIKVTGPITSESKNMLENYATGAHAFDKAFGDLVDYYGKSSEPTIILCFGDHLPKLGNDYGAFIDSKYLSGKDDPELLSKIYSTPFVVWSNYDTGPRESLRLSPCYLGAYLLHRAGKPGSYYTDFLYALSKQVPLIPPKKYYSDMHIDEKKLLDYERLQYDILHGSRTGYNVTGIAGQIVNPNFQLGYGQPVITYASVQNGSRLEVHGDYLTAECSVWLKGKMLKTTMYDSKTLSAALPEPIPDSSQPWEIEVKLVDYKSTIIAASKPFYMQAKIPHTP
jgi:phosphoglycerol transferase MdoB-like AlkP superfamily enzyme